MRRFTRQIIAASLTSATFIVVPVRAQDAVPAATADEAVHYDEEIVVTAQKREENLQDVPISIQALGTKKLEQLNVTNFKDYAALLPSVSFQALGGVPGTNVIYMRGVASGGDGNHSGTLPSVGVYLDEQPVTTIGGNLDVHVYDIARIESLAGPQGTLYGASSEAGTIRIITNKPSTSSFSAGFDAELNKVLEGDFGGKLEGYVNVPLSDSAALRVVGFYERDGGYIDNVPGTRSFLPPPSGGGGDESAGGSIQPAGTVTPQAITPQASAIGANGGIVATNPEFVENNYNDVETYGGRAALKIDLDDNWTVTPTVMAQQLKSTGSFGFDAKIGDLKTQHFFPEFRNDRFIQAALTIEGKLANWDLTYAGAYMDRQTDSSSDYTDYAEAYDSLYAGSGGIASYFYFNDAAGNLIDPRQKVLATDHFRKMSQELRVASPAEDSFRVVAGLFYQRQSNEIHQDYRVANLAPELSVNGFPGTLWLTQQKRTDKDYAIFGEASLDITPTITLNAGGRAFIYDNDLIGFFGFGRNPGNGYSDGPPNAAGSNRTGVAQCFTTAGERLYDRDTDTYSSSLDLLPPAVAGSPCTNLARYVEGRGLVPVRTQGQGFTHKVNLTWKPSDDVLLYATWSRGFRPGGINRRGTIPPYAADYLTNYELGWKTTLAGGLVRLNGAVYQQEWKAFQFAFLGPNSFTEIHNGPDARIRGIEADANFNLGKLVMTAAGSYTDAKIRNNLCLLDDPTFTCTRLGPNDEPNLVSAPRGTRLPVTPKFKASATARYNIPLGTSDAYVQGVVAYQSSASSDLRTAVFQVGTGDIINPAALQGRLKAFTSADFAVGMSTANKLTFELFVRNAFDVRGQLSRFQECGSCGQRPYIVPNQPRTIGVRAGIRF